MKNPTAAFFLLLLSVSLTAQDRLGLRIENYSGVNGLYLNPASGTYLPYSWDLNIISVEQFMDTNYGHIRNANLGKVIRNSDNIVSATSYDNESQIPNDVLVADFNSGDDIYYAQNNTQIMGPSFLYNLNNEHSFGIMTAARAAGGTRSLPSILGYQEFDTEVLNDEFLVRPFKIAGAAWAEIGLHYGYNAGENFSFGVNAKYLIGFEGFYFNSYDKTGLIKRSDNEVDFLVGNAEFGLTNTHVYDQEFNGLQKNGGGLSIDLGAMYTIEREYEDGYLLKLGVSILDLGYLRFNQNAETHQLNNINPFTIDIDDYQSITEYQDFLDLINDDIYGSNQSSASNSFSLALPAAMSIQADYALTKDVYLNATIIQHIPLGENRIARTDLLAITPRYERRWFGAMLPISVLNYDQVHVGLALRLGWLTIGSENLGSLVGNSNFTGTDLYLALKVNPFRLKERDRKWKPRDKRGVSKRGKRGKVKCYF